MTSSINGHRLNCANVGARRPGDATVYDKVIEEEDAEEEGGDIGGEEDDDREDDADDNDCDITTGELTTTSSDDDGESSCNERINSPLGLSRLKLALKYEQKQFVAHPHCQQLLASVWYDGLPGWRKFNYISKIFIILALVAAMPVMAFVYLLMPGSRLGMILRTPFMKFLYHSASFGVFLMLLILASTSAGSVDHQQLSRQTQRGPPPSLLELTITLYVIGFVWSECKQLWDEGFTAYMRQWWNWLDWIMLSLFLCAISLRIVAYVQTFYPEIYGLPKIPRSEWPDADPTIVSEGVFAIANVFSFGRIIFLFQANPQLGPLQISLGCMLIDIGKFLLIFFLVLTSFACGLNQLYYYYSDADPTKMADQLVSTSQTDKNHNSFNSPFDPIWNSYITLFWALFGLMPLGTVREGHVQNFTRRTGESLLMVYHIMVIIVLINMLIAMMSSSFQEIEDHSDREWKFARSKLWMGYFDEGSTLPPPFNIIISPKSIFGILGKIKRFIFGKKKCISSNNQSNVELSKKITKRVGRKCSVQVYPRRAKYEDVMRRLVGRFIHQCKKKNRQDGVNEDDILEIKQDISSLRYELRDDRSTRATVDTERSNTLRRDIIKSIRGNQVKLSDIGSSTGSGYADRPLNSRPPKLETRRHNSSHSFDAEYSNSQSHTKPRYRHHCNTSTSCDATQTPPAASFTTTGSKSIVRPLTVDIAALTKEVSKSVAEELLRVAEQLARVAPEKKYSNYPPATNV